MSDHLDLLRDARDLARAGGRTSFTVQFRGLDSPGVARVASGASETLGEPCRAYVVRCGGGWGVHVALRRVVRRVTGAERGIL